MFQFTRQFFSSLEVVFGPPFARVVFVTQKRVKQVKHFTVVAFSRQTHCYTQCYLHLSVQVFKAKNAGKTLQRKLRDVYHSSVYKTKRVENLTLNTAKRLETTHTTRTDREKTNWLKILQFFGLGFFNILDAQPSSVGTFLNDRHPRDRYINSNCRVIKDLAGLLQARIRTGSSRNVDEIFAVQKLRPNCDWSQRSAETDLW